MSQTIMTSWDWMHHGDTQVLVSGCATGGQTLVSLQHPAAAIPGYLVAAWLLLLCASQIMRAVRRRSPSANWFAFPISAILQQTIASGLGGMHALEAALQH